MNCSLLLVDDHSLIRAGVRALVEDLPGYSVIGEACDGDEVADQVRALAPDIVLLDLSMRKVGGLDALARLRETQASCKVLVLSMHTDPDTIMQALELGAHGYLLKDTTATELHQALDALREGERYLSPAIAHTVIDRALTRDAEPAPVDNGTPLTNRQLEILRLIVRGKSTREIAQGLGLSVKTIETHRAQIMKRLQIHDVAGLVIYSIREGIISLDD